MTTCIQCGRSPCVDERRRIARVKAVIREMREEERRLAVPGRHNYDPAHAAMRAGETLRWRLTLEIALDDDDEASR
jgi:hypothetical protein